MISPTNLCTTHIYRGQRTESICHTTREFSKLRSCIISSYQNVPVEPLTAQHAITCYTLLYSSYGVYMTPICNQLSA